MIERLGRILALCAHPDDEIGCAGTIARLTDGGALVTVLTFSDCADVPGNLRAEQDAALEVIGVQEHITYALPNRRLPEHRQEILDILDPLRDEFAVVLVPASNDAHQDHATVTAEAIRVFKRTTMLGYELPLNAVTPARLAAFISLTPALLERKVGHAQAYRSQEAKPYMAEGFIRGLAAVRGVQAGVDAAEAFEVIRWVA